MLQKILRKDEVVTAIVETRVIAFVSSAFDRRYREMYSTYIYERDLSIEWHLLYFNTHADFESKGTINEFYTD